MSWRDIKFSDVCFDRYNDRRFGKALQAVRSMARKSGEVHPESSDLQRRRALRWSQATLGEIAALGEKEWKRFNNVGERSVSVIKAILDDAAAGADVTRYDPATGYLPVAERTTSSLSVAGSPALMVPPELPASAVMALDAIARQRCALPAALLDASLEKQIAIIGAVAICLLELIDDFNQHADPTP